jgi:hypothetical protein
MLRPEEPGRTFGRLTDHAAVGLPPSSSTAPMRRLANIGTVVHRGYLDDLLLNTIGVRSPHRAGGPVRTFATSG